MGNIELFDGIASVYDTAERAEVGKTIANEIHLHVANSKAKTAIDYGCGTGLVGLNLISDFKQLIFVDASPNMVNIVQAKLDLLNNANTKALCIDFVENTSPLKVDCIFIAQTLLHIKEVDILLKSLFNTLNDGGQLLIVDFDKNESVESDLVQNGFDQSALALTVKRAGFSSVTSKTFYHGKNLFMGKDASMFILNAKKI